MPLFIVTCNGSLITKSGPIAKGGEVEMSESDAKSLPLGTVARKAIAPTSSAPLVESPSLPSLAVEAPRGRKGNKP